MNMSKRPRFSWTGGGPGGDVKEVSYSDSSYRKAGNLQQDNGYWTKVENHRWLSVFSALSGYSRDNVSLRSKEQL